MKLDASHFGWSRGYEMAFAFGIFLALVMLTITPFVFAWKRLAIDETQKAAVERNK